MHTATTLHITTPGQLKALANPVRAKILRMLEDRPASAKELGELLDMSHGKVGHHVKVLRDSGFIEVVDERPVRAVSEKFYGTTYDRLVFAVEGGDRLGFLFGQAAREALPASQQPFDPPGTLVTARLAPDTAAEFHRRLLKLAEEFAAASDDTGTIVYGMAAAVFATDTPGRR